jgi:hypothetical protein
MLLATGAAFGGTSGVAHASAVTCIAASAADSVCTTTSGTGDYLTGVEASWNAILPPYNICNYSAWFYYVPPTGGAYGISYQSRNGCGYGRVWLNAYTNRSYPNNTLICVKFYDNGGEYNGTDCVRLTN